MGTDVPKQFIPLAKEPMLLHSLRKFYTADPLTDILLVLSEQWVEKWNDLAQQWGLSFPCRIVTGGSERFFSVKHALDTIGDADGLVAIHDAARPFVSVALIDKLYTVAALKSSAIPVVPLKDSIRRLEGEASLLLDRSSYRLVQTPQVFSLALLKQAYTQAYTSTFTDDASVFEAAGHTVQLVEGDEQNFKITTSADLAYARYVAEHKPMS